MKTHALICDESQRFTLSEVQLPDPGPQQVLVRTLHSGVSIGTEFALITGKLSWGPYPLCTGYQGTGVVEAVGSDVTRLAAGDRVYYRGGIGMTMDDDVVLRHRLRPVPLRPAGPPPRRRSQTEAKRSQVSLLGCCPLAASRARAKKGRADRRVRGHGHALAASRARAKKGRSTHIPPRPSGITSGTSSRIGQARNAASGVKRRP